MAENRGKTAKRRRGAGRRFQKGTTGNPGGRPKALPLLKERIQARGDDLVDELFAIVDDLPREVTPPEGGHATFVGPTHKDRISAIDKLLAYGYGKPTATMELSGPGGGPIPVDELPRRIPTSAQQRARVSELISKAKEEGAAAGPEEAPPGPTEEDGDSGPDRG